MPVNTLFLEMPTVSLFEFTLNLCLIKHYYIFAVEYLTQLIVEFDNSKCFVNLEKKKMTKPSLNSNLAEWTNVYQILLMGFDETNVAYVAYFQSS